MKSLSKMTRLRESGLTRGEGKRRIFFLEFGLFKELGFIDEAETEHRFFGIDVMIAGLN